MKRGFCSFFVFGLCLVLFSCKNESESGQKENIPASGTDSAVASSADAVSKEYDPHEHLDHMGLENYFDSPRVDEWVKNKPPFEDEGEMEYVHDYLDAQEMAALKVEELIYYCVKYPAAVSQICADSWAPDSTETPKIAAHFYFDYSGETMSKLQEEAVGERSDSVLMKLREYLKHTRGDLDEKALVLLHDLDPVESIPVILETLSDQHLVNYTFLTLVLADYHYGPFTGTGIYQKLYGPDSWHFSKIEATPENRKLIAKMALDFYNSTKAP